MGGTRDAKSIQQQVDYDDKMAKRTGKATGRARRPGGDRPGESRGPTKEQRDAQRKHEEEQRKRQAELDKRTKRLAGTIRDSRY